MAIQDGNSEVARLLRQIDLEFEAAKQAATGLAVGVASHRFIVTRMTRVGVYQAQLSTQVGAEEALRLVGEHYVGIMEQAEPEKEGEGNGRC
jgi:hypothetical protein